MSRGDDDDGELVDSGTRGTRKKQVRVGVVTKNTWYWLESRNVLFLGDFY